MHKIHSYLKCLNPADFIVVLFGIILSLLNIIFYNRIEYWTTHVAGNLAAIIFIFFLAYFDKYKTSIISKQLHYWYLVPIILLTYKEIYFMVDPIRGIIYDDILIKIDRFLFGFDPTVELYSIATPILTEFLQIIYGTFFFLPVILGLDLLLSNKDDEFHFTAQTILLGFFLSYLGYILVPAIGPRFTLHNFALNNIEMPGIFLTDFLREIVNAAESIPAGTLSPELVVQRDAFPSGHTQITLIVIYLSIKYKTCTRYFLVPVGTCLIFSTVYLRYHYVIDLLAGALFMIFTIWLGNKIYRFWINYQTKPVSI
jgi:membrane-associated phospholipid phosphatase